MALKNEFTTAVAAAQAGIRVNTDELGDALAVISEVCKLRKWDLRVWDQIKLLQMSNPERLVGPPKAAAGPAGAASVMKPPPLPTALSALDTLLVHLTEPGLVLPGKDPNDKTPVVLVLKNFHLTFEGQTRHHMCAAVQHLLDYGKEHAKFIVGLMPAEAKLPPEVEPLFHVIDHELPDIEELVEILDGIIGDDDKTGATTRKGIAKAALGLTRLQAEGVYASSLVMHKSVLASDVWKAKAAILNKEGLVTLRESKLTFKDVGGLQGAKTFMLDLVRPDPLEEFDPDCRFRGALFVGPPGTGKTLIAYCVGNEIGIPTLLADLSNLKDQYVGNSEKRTRKFFQIVKRMAPCVAVVDEVNMALSGGGSGEHSVDKQILGSFLTNLNDMTEPVLWCFTANDVEGMHEAIFRDGRIDAKIYVRLPTAEQRAVIWALNLKKFFPKLVGGKADPRYLELNLDVAMAKPQPTTEFYDRIASLLMAMGPNERKLAVDTITELTNTAFAEHVQGRIVNDENWTGAKIAACCRLSRRLNRTVFETAKLVSRGRMSDKLSKAVARLDNWALNEEAIDAETGVLFAPPAEPVDEVTGQPVDPFAKKTRRVSKTTPST